MLSIRFKILTVIFLGMLVACAISAQSYWNALQFDVQVEEILSQSLQSSRTIRNAQDALRDVRAREDQLLNDWREAEELQLEQSLRQMLEQLHWGPLDEGEGVFAHQIDGIRGAVASYRELWVEWSAHLQKLRLEWRAGASAIREQGLVLQRRFDDLRLMLRPRATVTPPAPLNPQSALELGSDLRAGVLLEQAMVEAAYWNSFALPEQSQLSMHLPLLVEEAEQRHAMLRVKLDHLRQYLPSRAELEAPMLALEESFVELARRIGGVVETQTGQGGILKQQAAKVRGARDRVELALAALVQAHQQHIESEQRKLARGRAQSLTIMAITLAAGMLLVAGMGVVMSRGISRNFQQLVVAARDIQRGNLDARVRIRSRDELTELGQAFNAMARYLKDRRRRQGDYNDIVSLLNSTLHLQDLLSHSLRELVERSSSAIGAFYLADADAKHLHLAESFGMTSQRTQTTYALGQGLVGQAAAQRQKILLYRDDPPPPQISLSAQTLPTIDTGLSVIDPRSLLVLPLIHLDRLLGVLVVGSLQVYEDATVAFLEEVALQVSVALNNARFVQTIEATAAALKERTEELSAQRGRLEIVNKELADANRLQSDFLANVTHELRTPLNSIIGFTELVLDRAQLDPKVERNLQTVLRNATGLLGLINDLLDITKIEAGRSTMNLARFDLGDLIEECLQTISPMVAHHAVTLESRLEPSLPPIWSDRTKLKQILLNLLSNAAKFTEEGAIRVDVRSLDDHWIEVAVIDSGIGIHAEDLPFIFDKFRQVDGSISRKYGGTGLGLAITSELVKLLGGSVSAKSEVGAGSTFLVLLPLNALELQGRAPAPVPLVPAPPPQSLPKTPEITSNSGDRLTVLVIDEEPDTVISLRKLMRNELFNIQSAFICEDALFHLDPPASPLLLILGQPLPEDGRDATLKTLWERLHKCQVYTIVIEGSALSADLTRLALSFQVIATLPRPLSAARVLSLVRQYDLAPDLPPEAEPLMTKSE